MSQIIIPPSFNLEEKRKFLLDNVAELDATKRKIKSQIRNNSNNFKGKKDKRFFSWVREAKSKISHLQEEREECRYMVGNINETLKNRKRVVNSGRCQHTFRLN
jgi:uncharacterized protein YukE